MKDFPHARKQSLKEVRDHGYVSDIFLPLLPVCPSLGNTLIGKDTGRRTGRNIRDIQPWSLTSFILLSSFFLSKINQFQTICGRGSKVR